MQGKSIGLNGKQVLSVGVAVLMLAGVFAGVGIAFASHGASSSSSPMTVTQGSGASHAPPVPPTQVFYSNPIVFSVGVPTVTYQWSDLSPTGPFPAGTTVNFWISTTDIATGIFGSPIGTTVLTAGDQNLANVVTLTVAPGTAPGTYFIIANSAAAPLVYNLGSSLLGITVVSDVPTLVISPSTQPAGLVEFSGANWDANALVDLTLNYPAIGDAADNGAPAPTSLQLEIPTDASGSFSTTVDMSYFPQGPAYQVVAQEELLLQDEETLAPLGGITADAPLTIQSSVQTCQTGEGFPDFEQCDYLEAAPPSMVASISGLSGSSVYLYGFGFTADATVTSVTIDGVVTTFAPTAVGDDGSFIIYLTTSAAIATQGPATIAVTTNPGSDPSFPAAVVVSTPGVSTTLLAIDEFTGVSAGLGGDYLEYQGWGYAASGEGYVYFDGTASFITEVTDPNGYFLDVAWEAVPYLPNGPYSVFAYITDGYSVVTTASTTFTIGPADYIVDGFGDFLDGEYAASGSYVEVILIGLQPFQQVDVTDTGLLAAYGTGSLDALCGGIPGFCSVNIGFYTGGVLEANAVGILDVSYFTAYTTQITGLPETVTVVTLSPAGVLTSATYLTVGPAVLTPATSYQPSQSITLSISNLIPTGAFTTPEAANYAGPFGVEDTASVGPDGAVTFSTTLPYFLSSAAGTATVTFTNPETDSFVDILTVSGCVDPADGSLGNVLCGYYYYSAPLYTNFDFISSAAGSGAMVNPNYYETFDAYGASGTSYYDPWGFYPDPASAIPYGAMFDILGFPAHALVTVQYTTSVGTLTVTVATDANGAATYFFAAPDTENTVEPYGPITYSLVFSAGAVSITGYGPDDTPTYFWQLITAVSFLPAPFAGNGGLPATDYEGTFGNSVSIGSSITVYVNSFLEDSPLILVMTQSSTPPTGGPDFVGDFLVANSTTDANGDTSFTFAVPSMLDGVPVAGTWFLWVIEEQFNYGVGPFVVSQAPLALEIADFAVYTSGGTTPAIAGFPGELMQYIWVPGAGNDPNPLFVTQVSVILDGEAYATSQGTLDPTGTIITGYFLMPNAPPGSSWDVALEWSQCYDSAGSTTCSTYTEPAPTEVTLAIAEGNGALLTGISPEQIATVVAAVNATITTSLEIPLAELNAAVTSINGAVAEITTAFGTFNATLAAIDATVTGIASGVVTIETSLGTVTAALSALGATLVSVQATVLDVNTTLGEVQLTLNEVNANVTSVHNGVMTLTTDVGNLQVSVNSIGATIATVNGNVMTILTDMGTVQATLASLGTQISTIGNNVNTLLGASVKITTALGNLTGQVSVISGNVATISTAVGNLQATVNSIQSNTNSVPNLTTYIIIVIVLVIIAIVVALLAVMRVSAVARRLEGRSGDGPKSWEGPKTGGEQPPKMGGEMPPKSN